MNGLIKSLISHRQLIRITHEEGFPMELQELLHSASHWLPACETPVTTGPTFYFAGLREAEHVRAYAGTVAEDFQLLFC